jgi:hypothetical protein
MSGKENRREIKVDFALRIPNITKIGKRAFENCGSLEAVEFPVALKEIEASAFENCASLKTLFFPAKPEIVGPHAFDGCGSIEQL